MKLCNDHDPTPDGGEDSASLSTIQSLPNSQPHDRVVKTIKLAVLDPTASTPTGKSYVAKQAKTQGALLCFVPR